MNYLENFKRYNKPKVYKQQATVDTVNAGIPYYVASPKYGYEGAHVPIAGTVSEIYKIDPNTGELEPSNLDDPSSLWVTCTASRYQGDATFKRCSLKDDGVIHQAYSDRLAFLDPLSAKYYADTGKLPKIGNNMITLKEAINLATEAHEGQYRKKLKYFH